MRYTILKLSIIVIVLTIFLYFKGHTIEKPNFIIIYCDNLGYGDIGPFGSEINCTPNLDRMAEEGRKFTDFYSTSGVCTPCRASIMTGCYAQRVGMAWNYRDGGVLRPISPFGLNPEEITIAEILKDVGYHTGIIGKWHLGDQQPFLPTEQGFDYFYGIPYSDDMTQEVGQRLGERLDGNQWPKLPLMMNQEVIQEGVDRNLLTKNYTDKAIDFISEHHKEPFFLYMPQAMPGSTKEPFSSEAFRGKSKSGPWGDSVEELDWSAGQIMKKLEELGIAEKTLMIFTSDNGSPMGSAKKGVERGTNRPLYGRGYTTAEGGFRVPTLMWWPGTILGGTECHELTSTMDLLPTFANLSGGKIPGDRIIDGHDIWLLIEGTRDAISPYDAFYYYDRDQLQAVRRGPWKLFVSLDTIPYSHPHFEKDKSQNPLLFNVEEDISSRHNVAKENPHKVNELMLWVQKVRDDLGDFQYPGAHQRLPGKVNHPVPVRMN